MAINSIYYTLGTLSFFRLFQIKRLIFIPILSMIMPSDPRVQDIVKTYLPPYAAMRAGMIPCTTNPAIPHMMVTSYGVTNTNSLGLTFEIVSNRVLCAPYSDNDVLQCRQPNGRKCPQHAKPLSVQMSPAKLAYVRASVAALDPPPTLAGAALMIGPPLPPAPPTPELFGGFAGRRGRPRLATHEVKVVVYLQVRFSQLTQYHITDTLLERRGAHHHSGARCGARRPRRIHISAAVDLRRPWTHRLP